MAGKPNTNNPAETSGAYARMSPKWHVIETLRGGTLALRAQGTMYTPKYEEETEKGYQARLDQAVLLNMLKQTLGTLSGKPFSEPLKQMDSIPKEIHDLVLDNVDLQGNNLNVFARQWFTEGLAKAFAHVLVDMPRPQEKPEGEPRTLEDDRRENLRPYWVLIKPECVLFARAEVVDGVEVLQHVRIKETYVEQEGFSEVEKVRIRVLEPGSVQIWVPEKAKDGENADRWVLSEQWETELPYIPLVTFYTDREGLMEGEPPLLDLAWLNITHWQSTSDQRNILKVSRFPILACEGVEYDEENKDSHVTIGPNKVLYGPGKFKYVEHTGIAIEAGRKDLEDLERQMSGYGAEFLKKKPGRQTATARVLDSAESTSELSSMAIVFEDAVAQALSITADWLKLGTDGGRIKVVSKYKLSEINNAITDFMFKLKKEGDLSRHALINFAKSYNLLPEDFDADADWEKIVEEIIQKRELLGEALLDLDPFQQDEVEEMQDIAEDADADSE